MGGEALKPLNCGVLLRHLRVALRRFISGAQYRVQADPTDRLSLHLVGAKLHIVITIRQTNDLIRVDAAIKPVSDGHEDRLPAGAAAESWRSLRPPFFERIPVPSELAPSSRIDQVVLAFDDPWAPVAVFREDVNLEKAVTARSGTRDDLHAQKSLRVLFDKVMQATLASKRRALNLTGGFIDSDRLRLHDCPAVRSARSYMTRAVKLSGGWHSRHMTSQTPNYHGYRFPPEIISHAVWLYHRFCLSFRDAEDLLAQRGVTVTYETIRHWCHAFGPDYARRLRRGRGRMGDTWYLDELFVNIQGRRQYLWRAVDQDGDLIDILVQSRRDRAVVYQWEARKRTPSPVFWQRLTTLFTTAASP